MPGTPWWKTAVIYQIAVSSFADSDGDGRGDIRGVIEHLDYLRGAPGSLGVDAIWLTPVNRSPLRDFGYDVSDYRSIEPRFGTMNGFRELVDACHERGLRVITDLVLNHTSDEHPWFTASRSSREDPRRDWYVWRDGRGPGRPPNRWRAVVEGSAWERDPRTGQYYYHAFLPFQPDLNWRNPAVQDEMLDVARSWLEFGVDGFRLDLINHLYEDERLRDNPLKPGVRPYLAQRHLYDHSQPESLEVAARLRAIADAHGERVLLGEVFSDDWQDCLDYLGDGTDRLHLSFYLDFVRQRWSARGFHDSVDWLEEQLPRAAWPCYYLDNHDLPRSLSRLGGGRHALARAKVAAAMLLTLRGTPILYYGQELGMSESRVPHAALDDPIGRKFWPLRVGRDGCRTPMQWRSGPGAGFTTGVPWLPVDPSASTRNALAETGDPASLLSWYRDLIALRSETPALRIGEYRALPGMPRNVFAFERTDGDERVVVLLNFSGSRRRCDLRLHGSWRTLLSTHGCDAESAALAPYEARVLGARLHEGPGTA